VERENQRREGRGESKSGASGERAWEERELSHQSSSHMRHKSEADELRHTGKAYEERAAAAWEERAEAA
jgi:hypothetical protein